KQSIRQGKPVPDFTGTDSFQVSVTLRGEVQDPRFARFMEQIGQERLASFTAQDFLVLDLVHREQRIPDNLRARLPFLMDQGVIEASGRGRGIRYMLSRRFYDFLGKRGVYTRKRGLDRETNKALLAKHIQDNRRDGSPFEDLRQVLPALTEHQVRVLLRALKAEGAAHVRGRTKAGRWYPGPDPNRTENPNSS